MNDIFEIKKSILICEQTLEQLTAERDNIDEKIKNVKDEIINYELSLENDWHDMISLPECLLKIVDEYLQVTWPVLFRVNYKKYKNMSLGEIYNILNKDKNYVFALSPHESATLLKNCRGFKIFGIGSHSPTSYTGFLMIINNDKYQYRIIEGGWSGTNQRYPIFEM